MALASALSAGSGGTGIANPSAAGILLGSYAGGAWQQLGTSSLGLISSNVAEGSNLYWTNTRFDNQLSATSSLPNITTLANLSLSASQLTGFGSQFYTLFHATTTDALAEGSSNLYYTANRVAGVIAGTTTTALAEGSNLYFTNARADARVAADLAATSTTALAEGTNLYFTNGRVQTYLNGVDKGFFFSTTSADAYAAQRNFFSTTSANFWATGLNFFSTTSADYLATQRNFFSTTSANYFADSSTTIAKTYTNNSFGGTQTFGNASTTNISSTYASSTQGFFGSLSISNLGGILKAVAGAVQTSLVNLATDITGILPVGNGGTGWAALASGAIPYGNGSSALATTSAGTAGQVLALLNGVPTWTASTTFSTGLSYSSGNVTNTGVLAIGPTAQTQTGTVTIATSTTGNDFSVTGSSNTLTFNLPTASASNRGLLSTSDWSAFNGKQASLVFTYPLTNTANTIALAFGTTTSNTWASTQTFSNVSATNATSTFLFANTAGFGAASFGATATSSFSSAGALTLASALTVSNGGTGSTTLTGLLKGNGTGQLQSAVAGVDYASPSALFAYLFPGNATSTLLSFTGGLLATASTTIGNGNQNGGLTINGGATTTGNAYFAGNVGIGTMSPNGLLDVRTATNGNFVVANSADLGTPTVYVTAVNDANSAQEPMEFAASKFNFAAGNVGIGTTSPAYGLDVYGSGHYTGGVSFDNAINLTTASNNYIYFNSDLHIAKAGTGDRIRIDSSGNVGIGTTSPVAIYGTTVHVNGSTGGSLNLTGTNVSGFLASSDVLGALALATQNSYPIALYTNNAERLRITASGNVGIGTTTPNWNLQIAGTRPSLALSDTSAGANLKHWLLSSMGGNLYIGTSTDAYATSTPAALSILNNGNVGIGITSPIYPLQVLSAANGGVGSGIRINASDWATNGGYIIFNKNSGSGTYGSIQVGDTANNQPLALNPIGGNVGIGTTSPAHQLTTTGSVQFATFGAGTLTTDANGNLSVSSDERLKNIQGNFTRGLDDLLKLNPILYHWNALSGLEQTSLYAGFSAQNVQSAIPEAVGSSSSGYLTLQDRPLIAAAVNAIKEIATITGTFKSNLIAWLGNATNGITNFFAGTITATQKLCVQKSDGTNACVTGDQLAALLSQSASASLANPSPPSTSSGGTSATSSGTNLQGSTSDPIIAINGNNPANITVGSTYADLGATIVSPAGDTNLGITVLADNATTTNGTATVDTTSAGTHTIRYVVTDPAGLTGSATRTVIVSAPANDNTATSSLLFVPSPANDNPPPASASTTATSSNP